MATEAIDKELSDNGIKETQNVEIEQTYDTLMNEIGTDPMKEKFSEVIKALYFGFRTASGNEKILTKMFKDTRKKLADEIKINKTLNESQKEERRELDQMTQKYNDAIKAQQIREKEDRMKETAKNEFTISDKKDEPEIDEGVIQDLKMTNEQLNSELIELKGKCSEMETELKLIKDESVKFMKERNDLFTDKGVLQKKYDELIANNAKEEERKNKELKTIKDELAKHKKEIEEKDNELKKTTEEFEKKKNEQKELNDKLQATRAELSKVSNERDNLNKKIEKIQNEKRIISEREKNTNDLLTKMEEEKELYKKKSEQNENKYKERNRIIDKTNNIINEKNIEIEQLKGDVLMMTKLLADRKKEAEADKQMIEKQKRDKENVEEELKKQLEEIERNKLIQSGLLDDNNRAIADLEKNKKRLNESEKVYKNLERARDKSTEENTKLKNKIDHLLEDIRLGDNRVQELQKKVAEYEKKMKIQREVYDAVRRDKNLYFKNLIETQDDLVERQNLLQFNKKEIENLKSDLKKKDAYSTDIKGKNCKFEKALKIKEIDNNKLLTELEAKSKMCQAQEKEMEKLKINVEETAKNYSKLENEYKKTIIDRDNLSSQLIRRNDEVSILHEKIMILTTDMSKLEKKIQEKEDSINTKERTIGNLLRELKSNRKSKELAEKYARELINLNKELLREKNLNKALTEEVESSEKLFHRWRKLEGIDPDSLELHYKISLLQKRLISKTEECVEKEITIQDLTKELANCKKLANKKPLFEIEESIKKYKQELSKQYDRMKSIISELNMYRNQVEEYKTDNNRIQKENIDLQNKYHELKIRTNKMNA